MATIHVNRGGTNLGTFSEEEVRKGLAEKRFLGTDLGWREGMPSWQPLSQFTEFAGIAPAAAAPTTGAVAAAAALPAAGSAPPSGAGGTTTPGAGGAAVPPVAPPVAIAPGGEPRSGLPWEHRQQLGLVNAFVETVKLVLTDPNRAFTQMRTTGGIGEPLLFGVIGGSIGTIVWIIVSLIFNSLGLFTSMATRNSPLAGMFGFSVGGAFALLRLILAPICIVILLFIWSGLVHVCLMLVGGAKKDFEATFRPLSFAYGSTALFLILPCCGGIIGTVWGLVADCIGIARSHEIDTGKAVLAVFLPLIVCCGGLIVLGLMFGAFGAMMQHSNQ